MRVYLWLFSDGQVFPRVGTEFAMLHALMKDLQHVFPDPCLGLRCKSMPWFKLSREVS
jgi:hypothetical protein